MRKGFTRVATALSLGLLLAACGATAPGSQATTAGDSQTLDLQVNTAAEAQVVTSRIMVILDNGALGAQSVSEDGVVQIGAQAVENFTALASNVAAAHNLTLLRAVAPVSGFALFEVPEGVSAQGALRSLDLDPRVSAAGFDHIDYAMQNQNQPTWHRTNDPMQDRTWGMTAVEAQAGWQGVPRQSIRNVTVAVIDSGFGGVVGDTNMSDNHPDLGNVMEGYDFVSNVDLVAMGYRFAAGTLARFPQLRFLDADPEPGWDTNATGEIGASYAAATNTISVAPAGSHGMHVAGTIAAQADNGLGVYGVAPEARILPLRGLGAPGFGFTSDILSAVLFAAGEPVVSDTGVLAVPTRRADVINMSLGGFRAGDVASPVELEVYDIAVNARNVVVVASAGNSATVRPSFPASVPDVMSVSSTDYIKSTGQSVFTMRFSNFGPTIDVAAPGGICWNTPEDYAFGTAGNFSLAGVCDGRDANGALNEYLVLSTDYRYYQGTNVNTMERVDLPIYDIKAGTSMSAPHVAGVAALVRAANPRLNARQVREVIRQSATDVASDPRGFGQPGRDNYYGFGVVNARAAVDLAKRTNHIHNR